MILYGRSYPSHRLKTMVWFYAWILAIIFLSMTAVSGISLCSILFFRANIIFGEELATCTSAERVGVGRFLNKVVDSAFLDVNFVETNTKVCQEPHDRFKHPRNRRHRRLRRYGRFVYGASGTCRFCFHDNYDWRRLDTDSQQLEQELIQSVADDLSHLLNTSSIPPLSTLLSSPIGTDAPVGDNDFSRKLFFHHLRRIRDRIRRRRRERRERIRKFLAERRERRRRFLAHFRHQSKRLRQSIRTSVDRARRVFRKAIVRGIWALWSVAKKIIEAGMSMYLHWAVSTWYNSILNRSHCLHRKTFSLKVQLTSRLEKPAAPHCAGK